MWDAYISGKPYAPSVADIERRHILEEINQTPAWWDREYQKLVHRCFPPKPFDIADHDGCDLIAIGRYATNTDEYYCAVHRGGGDQ